MAMSAGPRRPAARYKITRVIRAAGDDAPVGARDGLPMPQTDSELVTRLCAGDEDAFMALVDRYGPVMMRIARSHVPSAAVAEEVVQEAWLGVLAGIGRFEGRSSLKTWILRILTNRAKTRGERERRTVPMSCVYPDDDDAPAVDPDRFQGPGGRYPGGWVAFPQSWESIPEERLLAQETLDCVQDAIRVLPARQQDVIVLRDVEGWSSEEVCEALDISEGNQRVLLHRARSRVRGALERYLEAAVVPA
jgi:RNA polymerase sigma-70 factor (ECF subfamily)